MKKFIIVTTLLASIWILSRLKFLLGFRAVTYFVFFLSSIILCNAASPFHPPFLSHWGLFLPCITSRAEYNSFFCREIKKIGCALPLISYTSCSTLYPCQLLIHSFKILTLFFNRTFRFTKTGNQTQRSKLLKSLLPQPQRSSLDHAFYQRQIAKESSTKWLFVIGTSEKFLEGQFYYSWEP